MGFFDLFAAPVRVVTGIATLPLDVAGKAAEVVSGGDNDEISRAARGIRETVDDVLDGIENS